MSISSNLTVKLCVDCCRNDVDASRGLLFAVVDGGNLPRTGVKEDGVAAVRRCSVRLKRCPRCCVFSEMLVYIT